MDSMVFRWRLLFGCSLVPLIGLTWIGQRLGLSQDVWLAAPTLGLIAACLLGLGGAVTGTRKRWPAAVALLCSAPMVVMLAGMAPRLPRFVGLTGVPGVMCLAGSFATAVAACAIVFLAPPRSPFDRIPPARLS
ncbi:MAG: hypothetical protein H7138_13190 [Myxococcales bacterium]|nr:hypothetical protein [Myxococcales bacterium]